MAWMQKKRRELQKEEFFSLLHEENNRGETAIFLAHKLHRREILFFLHQLRMPIISLWLAHKKVVQKYSAASFLRVLGVHYLPSLAFSSFSLFRLVTGVCSQIRKEQWLERERVWLGSYYKQELHFPKVPPIAIQWIDSTVGYGVFATWKIEREEFIGEYAGILRRYVPFHTESNDYCCNYYMGYRGIFFPHLFIDAQLYGNYTRFINHSDASNVATLFLFDQKMMRLVLYAKRAIHPGEQLTINYGESFWKKRKKKPLVMV